MFLHFFSFEMEMVMQVYFIFPGEFNIIKHDTEVSSLFVMHPRIPYDIMNLFFM